MYYTTPRGLVLLICVNEVNWVHLRPGSWVRLWMVLVFPSSTWREHTNPSRTGGPEQASQPADTRRGGASAVSREVTRCNWPQRTCENLRGKAASDNGCSGVTKVRAACYMIALTAHVREYFWGPRGRDDLRAHTPKQHLGMDTLPRGQPRRRLQLQVAEFGLDLLRGTFKTKCRVKWLRAGRSSPLNPSFLPHYTSPNFPFTRPKVNLVMWHCIMLQISAPIHWPVLRCVTSLLGPLVIVYIM